jgi:glycine cleavage system protein P-like pyridoxal-binding family
MDSLGEFAWVMPLAIFVGTVMAVYKGYTKARSETQTTMHGAVMIDSALGHELTDEMRRFSDALERVADTAERVEKQMQKTAADEAERARTEARIAAEREKWDREQREHDK